MYRKWLLSASRSIVVLVGIIVLTSFSIDATDTLQGSKSTLFAQLMSSEANDCDEGMTPVIGVEGLTCMDIYEASAGDGCPFDEMLNEFETLSNVSNSECIAVSVPGKQPWRFVTREQADIACVRAGKRLPSAQEWYRGVIGTPDTSLCNIDGEIKNTGAFTGCVSGSGVIDGVGNVWEWVRDDVNGEVYNGRKIPTEGFVSQVDMAGVAVATDIRPNVLYGEDYFWSETNGNYGMIRGGFYDSQNDAGVFTLKADIAPDVGGAGIGFRCVK